MCRCFDFDRSRSDNCWWAHLSTSSTNVFRPRWWGVWHWLPHLTLLLPLWAAPLWLPILLSPSFVGSSPSALCGPPAWTPGNFECFHRIPEAPEVLCVLFHCVFALLTWEQHFKGLHQIKYLLLVVVEAYTYLLYLFNFGDEAVEQLILLCSLPILGWLQHVAHLVQTLPVDSHMALL